MGRKVVQSTWVTPYPYAVGVKQVPDIQRYQKVIAVHGLTYENTKTMGHPIAPEFPDSELQESTFEQQ